VSWYLTRVLHPPGLWIVVLQNMRHAPPRYCSTAKEWRFYQGFLGCRINSI
jgi:hypothetical protein